MPALGSFPPSVDLDRGDQSSRLEGERHRATPVDYPHCVKCGGGGPSDAARSTPYVGATLVASATELAPPMQPLNQSPSGGWLEGCLERLTRPTTTEKQT